MNAQRVVAAAIGLVVVVACLVALRMADSCRIPSSVGPAPARADGAGSDVLADAATGSEAAELLRLPVDPRPKRAIVIELTGSGGEAVPGSIAWRSCEAAPPSAGGASFELLGRDPSVRGESLAQGRATLDVFRDEWVAVAARAVNGRVLHRLVPPSSLPQQVGFRFGETEPQVECVVLDASGRSVVREGSVRCLDTSGRLPERDVAVDPGGVTRLRMPDPGLFRFVAPGAYADDVPPHAVEVAVHRSSDPAPVVLVVPPPRGTVELELELEVAVGDGRVAPKQGVALLRRIDDGSFSAHPWPQPLRRGLQRLRWKLPVGDYRLETWPAGALVESGTSPALHVRRGEVEARRVRVETSDGPDVALRLDGLGRADLPVSVLLQSADGVLDAGPDSAPFLGVWTWRSPAATVPAAAASSAQWVLAHGRAGTWISERVWAGEAATLAMRPATWVRIEWIPGSNGVERAWAEIDSPLGSDVVPLRREFGAAAGAAMVSFVGGCCLPREAFRVRCLGERADGATSVAWSRDVEVRGGTTWVIEGGAGSSAPY